MIIDDYKTKNYFAKENDIHRKIKEKIPKSQSF